MAVNRRQTLQVLAGAGVIMSQAGAMARAAMPDPVFAHGVASGDPDQSSVVLWTRVTTSAPHETLLWQVAADPHFGRIIGMGQVVADAARDHTAKVLATGLAPGATYYYRFMLGAHSSPVGRTRTLPVGHVEKVGLALASCSNYAFGYFNAYDAIARDPQVQFVVHTGDYIYEYGADEWGDDVGQQIGRPHDPPHEIVTLDDYRRRHAQYKTDAGAQAMHAAHPLIAFWDDHEIANNPWKDGAGNHQPETEGDWAARRDAGLRAYFEWMPIRDPRPDQALYDYWRDYDFGDLATLITLETRHDARDAQPAYPDFDAMKTQEDRDRYVAEELGNPDRRMLSDACTAHVRAALSQSVAQGQRWRLIGSASPMARFMLPDFVAAGIPEGDFPEAAEYMIPNGRWNLPWYSDTWDGYPVARQAFYDMAREVGASDLLVLTGDTHNFFASALADDAGRPVGVEIGATGIASPGEFRDAGFPPERVEQIDRIFMEGMDEVHWTESVHNGYVRLVLTPEAADVTFVGVDTVAKTDYQVLELHDEKIVKAGDSLGFL